MRKFLYTAAVGGICVILSAPFVQARDWNGLWVGGFVGGTWVDKGADLTDILGKTPKEIAALGPSVTIDEINSSIPLSLNLDESNIVGGAEVGFNMQNGMWVFGVVLDISSGVDGATVVSLPGGGEGGIDPSSTTASFDMNWLATLRLRAGVLVAPDLLVFATGGLAFADVDYNISLVSDIDSLEFLTGSDDATETGWTLGGGLEYAFNSNWSVEVEGLYFDLGDKSVTITDVDFPDDSITYNFDNTGYIARVGVKYKFGTEPAPEPFK